MPQKLRIQEGDESGGMGPQVTAQDGPCSVKRPKPDLTYRTGTAASINHGTLESAKAHSKI